ncbi:MAG TPA: response regulator [Woeseiaceae bacterium]|nr:response regulator [Woeseiaceae bacterium]
MSSNGYLRKPNVLAVDDQPANLLALEAVLETEHNIVRAISGDEAIAILEARDDIDVILLDVQMPGMDGFETAERIKAIATCEDIPIVFITAVYYEHPHIKRGYAAGGIDYFGKPFDPDILRMKIGIYASFRHRAQMLKERERQVRESEELLKVGRKLSAVLESLPAGVLIADAEGRIVQTTEEVSRILKSVEPAERDAYGEILGWWDTGGKAIKDHDAPLARAVRDGQASHSKPLRIRCCDDTTKTIITSTLPLRGLDKRIVGAVILLQDLTETKEIEEAFEERVTNLVGLSVELEQTGTR